MKPSEVFGIIVRTVGLLALLNGVWYLVYALSQSPDVLTGTPSEGAKAYFIGGVPFVIGGALLLRGADWFVRFSYPEPVQKDDDTTDASTA